jgi:hypothetical protein
MEFLKQYLGDELYAQVEAALKDNDKVKLANLADGGYVAKGKFDDLETEKAKIAQQVADLQKVDGAALQAQVDQLTKDNGALKLGRKLDSKLMASKAMDVTAVGALLDMGKISLDESGQLVGADEQIKGLQQSHAWAFAQTSVPGAGGNPPAADQSAAEEAKMKAAAGLPVNEKTA